MAALSVLVTGMAVAVAGGWSSPEPAHLHLDSGLLVSTRTAFRACLDFGDAGSLGPDRREAALALVGAGLDEVRRHPDWEPAGLGSAGPAVSLGCPGRGVPPLAGDEAGAAAGPPQARSSQARSPQARSPQARSSEARSPAAQPSPYRLWIYVLDGPAADGALGPGVPAGRATAETLDGAEVSTAVLVREAALADAALVRRLLTSAIGLSTDGSDGSSGSSGTDATGGTGGQADGTK